MRFLRALLVLLLCLAAAPATARQDADARSSERITVELVSMSAWAAPGSTAIVALRQDIRPGWHTYWRNPGDSGGAARLAWTLPPGFAADDILWSTPRRQRLQSLVNYGYEGEVLLPVTIRVPADARVGTTARLQAAADLFVCSDSLCVPERMSLSLDLPIRAGAAPLDSRWGRAVADAVAAAPRPAGLEGRVTRAGESLSLSLTGDVLAGVTEAYFFPDEPGRIDHAAAQFGRTGPRGLTLELAPAKAGAGRDVVSAERLFSGVLATDQGAWTVTARPGAPLEGATGGDALRPLEDAAAAPTKGEVGLLQAGLLALLGGLLLNLMPCVFPILAMKAAALAGTAAEPRTARVDGLAFLAGVMATFLALAGVLIALRAGGQALGWGFQLQSPAVVAGLTLVMLASALNLSGVYHVGGALQRLAGGRGAQDGAEVGGRVGACLTGVLAVVIAAPCTAPFMATALGAALTLPAPAALTIFGLLGLGFAAPYVALSLSPAVLRRLPRPGPWMQGLQRLLAFPLYGAAAWLAWVFARQAGVDPLALLLAAAILSALGLWLVGRAQDGPAGLWRRVSGVSGGLILAAALGLAILAARAPPEAAGPETAATSQPWSPAAVAQAQGQGRPVLVNFTADWCVTCKVNEAATLGSPGFRRALERTRAVYLVADWTRRDEAIARELERHGRSGVPLYLVYAPGSPEPRILPQLLSEGAVVDALENAR